MLGPRKSLNMVARNTDIYTEVENWIGKEDKALVFIETSARAASQPYRPMPGYVCIGSVTAHPQSGPWFVLMALEENAQGIIDRYNARFGYDAPAISGTPPNTSLILTPDELAFIDEHYGGSKSSAIHTALALLRTKFE